MKTILKKIAVTCLFCLLAIRPAGAEPNTLLESGPAATNLIELQKLQLEKDLESDRLKQQQEIEKAKYNSQQEMVHDLTNWSWVIFVIMIFFFGYLRDKRRHETIRLMIEKGTPLTPELLDGLRKRSSLGIGASGISKIDPCGYLRWGVTLTLVGIALLLVFHGRAQSAGCIVLAVGVADWILWFIEKASSNKDQTK